MAYSRLFLLLSPAIILFLGIVPETACCGEPADSKATLQSQHPNQDAPDVDVEIKLTMPAPFVNGYVYGLPINVGVQFNKLLAVETRAAFFARDALESSRLVSLDVGIAPVVSDKRMHARGWVTQIGGSVGYAFESWRSGADDPAQEDFARYHFATANFIWKSTHWWKEHFGIIFQIRLVSGWSIHAHTWQMHYRLDEYSAPTEKRDERKSYGFADEKIFGFRIFWGVAF